MKKNIFYILIISITLLFFWSTYATDTDTQLIDLEDKSGSWEIQQLNSDFHLKKFSSCQNMKDVIKKYVKDYFSIYPYGGDFRWRIDFWLDEVLMNDSTTAVPEVTPSTQWTAAKWIADSKQSATDFSSTNIQVVWVDESEIIKTDWKNIYFYNEKTHSIYIAKAFPSSDFKILKIIKIPKSFSSPELYINWNKLIVVSTKYLNRSYDYYWFNKNTKTVVVVYDMSDINNLKIDKYYQVDWYFTKSRRVGKYLYILSQSDFNFPYNAYFREWIKWNWSTLDETKIDSDFNIKKVMPNKIELKKTSNKNEQNYKLKWKTIPYNISSTDAWNCTEIEYVMPETETLKKYNFTPSYGILSIINTEDFNETVKTKVLFWDVSEIYMSTDNLYITSNLYVNYNFSCPQIKCIQAPCRTSCIMPYYYRGENTLIHKIWINWNTATYKNSNIIPGKPLNQYSMDQNSDWYFRIITSSSYPERYTNLFILDKDLGLYWSLKNIAKDENFQSSRFIGDKLYLVTFEQIDPLFVIDLGDNKVPKILWELKIPGYSTYLHPYDSNHLIGLGYDTKTNKWWGTQNAGLKIDLYDISDFANPKQKYTLTFWDIWSSSEVLHNPKLFVWHASKNLLFIPATLYINALDPDNLYRNKDAFQWTITVKIDKDSWIKEQKRITHIDISWLEQKRIEECKKYSSSIKPTCKKLIDWSEYCPPVSSYVPEYCYENSPIWEYFANQIWNFNSSFIIRNLYLDNTLFTVSNEKIQSHDINNNYTKQGEVNMK